MVIDLLDAHELPDDSRSLLAKLMQSPHTDLQKFALRKMGDVATPATIRTLVEELGDADYRKRDVAASSLRKIPEARNVLLKELATCEDPSKAWSIAELLPSFEGKWRQDTLERLVETVAAGDRRRRADSDGVPPRSQKAPMWSSSTTGWRIKALKLVKGKKYKEAVGFLAPLKDFPASSNRKHRYSSALAQLKLHAHTLATNRQHPAVELLAGLYRGSAYPVFETLRKEKSLTPEELFALGFSLAERTGQERGLGVDLLEHVAEKFPRNKIGKNAKNKLKLIGA